MDSQRTVLIVDPDSESRESLSFILASQGYRVHAVAAAAEALDWLRHRTCPVAIWEQASSDGGGVEFVRQAREAQPDTRVIVRGGDRNTALGCLREQAYIFFRKPYSSPVLFEMVDHALEGGVWRPDITLQSASPDWVTLELRARFAAGDRVVQFLRELTDGFPQAETEEFASALREILLNSIEHGGHADSSRKVGLRFVCTARSIICLIADPGNGFSLDAIPHAAVSNPAGDALRHVELREVQGLRPGGYGIMVARNLVDELVYNQRGNEVLIVKYRKGAPPPLAP